MTEPNFIIRNFFNFELQGEFKKRVTVKNTHLRKNNNNAIKPVK